jgi:hypothetical protein
MLHVGYGKAIGRLRWRSHGGHDVAAVPTVHGLLVVGILAQTSARSFSMGTTLGARAAEPKARPKRRSPPSAILCFTFSSPAFCSASGPSHVHQRRSAWRWRLCSSLSQHSGRHGRRRDDRCRRHGAHRPAHPHLCRHDGTRGDRTMRQGASPRQAMQARCCIVGGGPAGIVLGFLLARAGVEIVVLEKHADFLRDFRGDTIHPSR